MARGGDEEGAELLIDLGPTGAGGWGRRPCDAPLESLSASV